MRERIGFAFKRWSGKLSQSHVKTRQYVLSFLLLGFSGWLLCLEFRPFQPRYQGKLLSQWVDILILPWDSYPSEQMAKEAESQHGEAEDAIRHIGKRAFPYAIKWSRARDWAWDEKVTDWFGRQKLFGVELKQLWSIHFMSAYDLHQRGAEIFRILQSEAKPEIPILVTLFSNRDPGVIGAAMDDLYKIGPDALPAVTRRLQTATS
jgi:hypothetical protein